MNTDTYWLASRLSMPLKQTLLLPWAQAKMRLPGQNPIKLLPASKNPVEAAFYHTAEKSTVIQ